MATGYELDIRGSISDSSKVVLCTPQWPNPLWGPASLLSSFPGDKAAGAWNSLHVSSV
jgi:hypothetical protein